MGRWVGGVYGNTVGSDTTISNTTGIFTLDDHYYIKQEGGWQPPPDGSTEAKKVTSAADLAFNGQGNGNYWVDIHGWGIQMEYDSSVKFNSGAGAGVAGWIKMNNSFLASHHGNLSYSSYDTGNPLGAGWANQGNGGVYTGRADQSNTGATGIGHVRFKIPKFQYVCINSLQAYGHGGQTPDDDTSWWSNTGYRGNLKTYAVDRVPNMANPGGYVWSCYEEGATGMDSQSACTQGIVIPKQGGECGNLSGEVTKTFSGGDFIVNGYDDTATNNCWLAAFSGDSGHEQIDYRNWEIWFH